MADNVLNRNFTATKPNQVWLADMTYIPTAEGVLYLSIVEDLFSRRRGNCWDNAPMESFFASLKTDPTTTASR